MYHTNTQQLCTKAHIRQYTVPYLNSWPLAAAPTTPPEDNIHNEAANNHAASKYGPEGCRQLLPEGH
jgi:hypothetical protein